MVNKKNIWILYWTSMLIFDEDDTRAVTHYEICTTKKFADTKLKTIKQNLERNNITSCGIQKYVRAD